jgi:DNA polymerase-3 subunit epsilon
MPWTDHPVFFIDFEGSIASGVLEYGVATMIGGRVQGVSTRCCAPTGRVRDEETEVHGLRTEILAGFDPFSSDWEVFAKMRENGPFAAHYAGVESSLLRSTWPYGRTSPDFARPGQTTFDWGPWIDTARIYGQLYPRLRTGRLDAMVAACGLQGELDSLAAVHCPSGRRRYHAALYDALAGALLLGSLARYPELASLSLTQLIALSTLDPKKRESIVQRELF